MIEHVKSFGKINCLGQCAEWGTGFIEALGYLVSKGRRVNTVEWLGRLGERGSELSSVCRRRFKIN